MIIWQIEGASLLALAAAVCVDLRRTHQARRNLTRLVLHLRDAAPGGLRAALAQRLDDPELLIAYPIDGGRRHVDAEARDVDLTPTADRSLTPLTRSGVELATLMHQPGLLTQPHHVDDLVASVQLALESERLAAEDLAQLAEIRSSGARIVTAGDAERRRIERDLHDGSQQRLVALLLTLRLLQTEAATPALVAAETELRKTIIDLRQLAHGVYPVLLKDAGLRAALESLAETRQLAIESTHERYPDVVESTIYLFVTRLSAAGQTTVRISRDDSHLIVRGSADGQPDLAIELDDRVRTLGGNLETTVSGAITSATLKLPIQSHRHPT